MWLAGLNPDWEFAAIRPPGAGRTRHGGSATSGQRRNYLASVLATDPDAARDLVAWRLARGGSRGTG